MTLEALDTAYDILEPVASSRDADLFFVKNRESGERFLLKSLRDRKGKAGEPLDRRVRFRRELDFVSSLEHPNIAGPCATHAAGQDYALLYPFRGGTALEKLVEGGGALPAPRALDLVLQLLDALEYLHARGIVHCGINPHNIFVTDEGRVELLDFGMSMTEDEAAQLPDGRIVGTFPYLSPEQTGFTDWRLDSRSDLFCAAIVLYRLLSGALPFAGGSDSIVELLNRMLKTEVYPVKSMPASLNAVLLKALQPSLDDRYQTAAGLRHDLRIALRETLSEPVGAFTPGEKDAVIAVNRHKLFVGRDTELDTLHKGLKQLLAGLGSSFLLYGKSGIGKTEIVKRFSAGIDEKDALYVPVKCNRFSASQPYAAFRAVVQALLLKIASRGPDEVAFFKRAMNGELADYAGPICAHVPEMSGYFNEIRGVEPVEMEKEAERVTHVLSAAGLTLFTSRPLVVWIDDCQWLDPNSLGILRRIVAARRSMIILCFRTEKGGSDLYTCGQDLRKIGIDTIVAVGPFSFTEARDLLHARFGPVADPDALLEALFVKTGGCPFTLTEAMRFLVNERLVRPGVGGWTIDKSRFGGLPERFDAVSLVLDKLKWLTDEDRRYLELASLVHGLVETDLVGELGGYDPDTSRAVQARLETAGFILRKVGGSFSFAHDGIQESVLQGIGRDDRLALYERLGALYESRIAAFRENLFSAAECYLKSRNLGKSIELCYQAATYAVEKAAFDVAIRYFTNTTLMASQCPAFGLPSPLDMTKVQSEFGDVLMLTGRNQQALNIFVKLVGDASLDRRRVLETKYRIGMIYRNMGDFDNSVRWLSDAAAALGIRFPRAKILMLLDIVVQVTEHALLSCGLKYLLGKKRGPEAGLTVRILNKLSYAQYHEDMLVALLVHLKALNLAVVLEDCVEKVETYATHIVAAFQLLLKSRAYRYAKRVLSVSGTIERRDVFSFAAFSVGAVHYFDAKWKEAERHLRMSLESYRACGDLWGQITPLEHLAYIAVNRGDLRTARRMAKRVEDLGRECNDLRGLVQGMRIRLFLDVLEGRFDAGAWQDLKEKQGRVHDALVTCSVDMSVAGMHLMRGEIKPAFDIARQSMRTIREKNLNPEYLSWFRTSYCETLIDELNNRRTGKGALPLKRKQLVKELGRSCRRSLFTGLKYPGQMGGALRSLAWHCAFRGRRRLARYFFGRAIDLHHSLDMRFEEGRSLRDDALFLESCNLPGEARDRFGAAYRLFARAGAWLEVSRLSGKVDRAQIAAGLSTASAEARTALAAAADHQRVDEVYKVSASMTEVEDVDVLLAQILNALIKTTGAQYGCMFMEADNERTAHALARDSRGRRLDCASISCSKTIISRAREERKILLARDGVLSEKAVSRDTERVRSVLCAPLCHNDKYLGCVYLANNTITGLFSEGSKTAAEILSAQASILLENAYLIDKYKRLNKYLQQKVTGQSADIRDKNAQLEHYGIKLLNSERMKNLLTGTIVHDIKNAMTSVQGSVQLLGMRFGGSSDVTRFAKIAEQGTNDILSLTSNMLDIGRMDEGKLALRPEPIDYVRISAMIGKFRDDPAFLEKNIVITILMPPDPFEIDADPYLLERVVQNLFSNAAKYVPVNGRVEVRFDTTEREKVASFFNTGTPIPESSRETLFEKYSQAGQETTQYSKGLGLFFCKMVMTAHHGRIWVEAYEQGNCFRLGFPRRI